jgi:hypothetical protein
VVAKDADRCKPTVGHVRHNAAQLFELVRTAVGDPIAGENYEVGTDLLNSAE